MNPVMVNGDLAYVQYRNADRWFTASVEDLPTIRQHRWRVVNNAAVTVKPAATEVIRLDVLLMGASGSTYIHHINGQVDDYSRSNLSLTKSRRSNTIIHKGTTSFLVLPCKTTVYLDSEDVDRVRPYVWSAQFPKDREVYIRTNYRENGKRHTLTLTKFVLGLHNKDNGSVIDFLNGDRFDCRKSNLAIRYSRHER